MTRRRMANGDQMRDLQSAEVPGRMWKVAERLGPEDRVSEGVPVEDVVHGYAGRSASHGARFDLKR